MNPAKNHHSGRKIPFRPRAAFSLVELLTFLLVLALLLAIALPSLASVTNKARNTQCLARLRNLGTGILLYSQDNDGEFPRSFHSCSGAGKTEWSRAILPYLDRPAEPTEQEWEAAFNTLYRCPSDKNRNTNVWSYALNVYFELSPEGDDYDGAPATWHRRINVPHPNVTILLAEARGNFFNDHLMCHQWSGANGARNAVDSRRHGKISNYLFVDGHAESLPLEMTFNPAQGINRWNPSKAK